jgi:hypothetical protein
MAGPAVGTVEDGYEFIGGDPGDDASWQPVASMASFGAPQGGPPGATYDTIDPMLRAVVNKLPTDQMRQQALEQSLRNKGIANPQVQGSGRDWYMVDPQTGTLQALTNTPEWDRYDALEGMIELPRVVAGTLGAAGGTALAGPLGGVAGAGAGGALGDAATRMILAQMSPEFKDIAASDLTAMAKDVGVNAAIDAGTFGVARAAGPLARAAFGKPAGQAVSTVMNRGVISPAVEGAGKAIQTVGKGTANVARTMQTPFGRSVATMGIPGVGEAEVVGELAKLPSAAARNLPKGMQRLGSTQFMQDTLPDAASWLRQTGQGLRRGASQGSEEALSKFRVTPGAPTPAAPTSRGVLSQVAEAGAKKAGLRPQNVQRAGQAAGVVGDGLDALATGGQAVASTARGIAGAGLAGAQAAGRATQGVGSAIRTAGRYASPFESRAAIQSSLDFGKDEFSEYLDSLRRGKARANINAILVDQ